ncbi:MAG: cobalamin-dependent protein [Planctomycetes bacterium]|nr:cobalamin-dependent protein [Planctomycetota bacterium]
MKILLVTPHISMQARYGNFAGAGNSTPTLGLLMLAAVAQRHGHSCVVVDAAAAVQPLAAILHAAQVQAPDLIGISSTTLSIMNAAEAARALKAVAPGSPLVLGGPHVSAVPEETMARFPEFDIGVLGEGEETFVELLAVLARSATPETVRGLIFRQDGRLVRTGQRPPIRTLDALPPPAWELLEGFPQSYLPAPFKTRLRPAASIVTTRGCPNRCIFCDRSVFGSSCHGYSAKGVIDLVEDLQRRFGIREICFEDDTFTMDRDRLDAVCHDLCRLKRPVAWSCLGRVNHVEPEMLANMRRAGCWYISFGIESGNQAILDRINKRTTLVQIRQAVIAARAAGITVKGFFMVGHPGETRATLVDTVRFALDLPLDDISVTMFTPFPGSAIHAQAAEFGTYDPDWSRMNLLNAVFVPHGLTVDDLVAAQREMLRRFYRRPRIMANYLWRLARNPALCRGFWQGLRALRAQTV